jgi:tetratricopeptide (TPR) repeat protein
MHVLQGTMQKDEAAVRFRFQLVNATDGVTRWEQTYAPKLEDIMVLQEDVAISVARLILERSPTGLVRRETRSGAAYLLVLRGNDQALVRSDSAARRALELFRQAVALDSGYARAWAGLARMYVLTTATLPAAGRDRQLALASQAAQRAVTLNDSLAEAHAALGMARSALFDMAAAETHMLRALELDPTRAAHESLVDLYLWTGRHDEALAIAERALERDPRSPFAHADVARVLQLMNRCDEALTHLDRVASGGRPIPARAAETRALCHAQAGRWNDAVAAARSAVTARDSSLLSLLAWLHGRAGNNAESARVARLVNDRVRRGRSGALDLALLDAGARNFDAAARRVQEAVDARSFVMAPGVEFATLTAPVFQELHRHRGFVEARRRLGYR